MSPDDERHGTRRGYYAHRRDDEDACDPCKAAAVKYVKVYNATRGNGQRARVSAIWAPPLAWDNIDNPAEMPHGIPTPTRKESAELLVEDWHMLRRNGYARRAARPDCARCRAADSCECACHDAETAQHKGNGRTVETVEWDTWGTSKDAPAGAQTPVVPGLTPARRG